MEQAQKGRIERRLPEGLVAQAEVSRKSFGLLEICLGVYDGRIEKWTLRRLVEIDQPPAKGKEEQPAGAGPHRLFHQANVPTRPHGSVNYADYPDLSIMHILVRIYVDAAQVDSGRHLSPGDIAAIPFQHLLPAHPGGG